MPLDQLLGSPLRRILEAKLDSLDPASEAEGKPPAIARVHRGQSLLPDIQALESKPSRHLLRDAALAGEATILEQAYFCRTSGDSRLLTRKFHAQHRINVNPILALANLGSGFG